MASAKLTKAFATGNVVIRKAPGVSGEVNLVFNKTYNKTTGKWDTPNPIVLKTHNPVDPLKRTDVSLLNLRNSNLEKLHRKGAIVLA